MATDYPENPFMSFAKLSKASNEGLLVKSYLVSIFLISTRYLSKLPKSPSDALIGRTDYIFPSPNRHT